LRSPDLGPILNFQTVSLEGVLQSVDQPEKALRKASEQAFGLDLVAVRSEIVVSKWCSSYYQTLSRDCLESSRRVLDRLCLVLQEGEMGHFRPVLATRYTPNRGLLGLSRQSLEEEFCEVRIDGVLRSTRQQAAHQ
jgi:hypothetical protein